MRRLLGSLMGALLAAALPAVVRAQASFDSIAAHLKPGQHVRVRASGGPRLEGRLAAVTTAPTVLQITAGDTVQSVRVADSLWVRGNRTVTGLVVGGAAFALAGAVVFPSLCGDGGGPGSSCNAGALTIASAGAGALLGVAIGSGIHTWRLRYASSPAGVGLVPLPGARLGIAVLLRSPAGAR
ncbi:MAG TPA: hypothetical protein VKD28_17335 [Gemmatimonadales bacterium]|nr:hypothetical protein [Gemmatimonadales bacterium]